MTHTVSWSDLAAQIALQCDRSRILIWFFFSFFFYPFFGSVIDWTWHGQWKTFVFVFVFLVESTAANLKYSNSFKHVLNTVVLAQLHSNWTIILNPSPCCLLGWTDITKYHIKAITMWPGKMTNCTVNAIYKDSVEIPPVCTEVLYCLLTICRWPSLSNKTNFFLSNLSKCLKKSRTDCSWKYIFFMGVWSHEGAELVGCFLDSMFSTEVTIIDEF